MEKERNIENFNKYEYIILKFELILLAIGLGLFGLAIIFIDSIGQVLDSLVGFVLTLWGLSIVPFIWGIIRIIRYLLFFRVREENIGILRTVIAVLLSPLTFIIFYILIIILAFSGCTVV